MAHSCRLYKVAGSPLTGIFTLLSDQYIVNFLNDGGLAAKKDMFPSSSKDVRAYSAFNGHFLGSLPLDYDSDLYPGPGEEVQSLAFVRWGGLSGGQVSDVQILFLDNDVGTDDVFIQHFAVPDPAAL
jgi:hypothetical protein